MIFKIIYGQLNIAIIFLNGCLSNANSLRSGNKLLTNKSFNATIDCKAAVLDFCHNMPIRYPKLSSYVKVLPESIMSMLKFYHSKYHQTRFETRTFVKCLRQILPSKFYYPFRWFCALSNNLSLANLSNFSGVSAGTSTILNQSVLLGTINLELDTDERSVTLSGSWLDFCYQFCLFNNNLFSDSESEVSDSLFSLMLSSSSPQQHHPFSSSSSSPSTSSGTSSSSLTTIASSSPKPIPFMNFYQISTKILSNFESSSNSCSLLSSSLSIPSTSFKSSSVAPNANASRRNISSTPLVFGLLLLVLLVSFYLLYLFVI